jgi:CoA-transferase family III
VSATLTKINIDDERRFDDDKEMTTAFRDAFGISDSADIDFVGNGALPSVYDVTGFVTASLAAVAQATQQLVAVLGGPTGPITIDRRLASMWLGTSIAPMGWELPPVWDAIAGDYQAADGWIRLHTNAATHRAAALAVLACAPTKEGVTAAVATWGADDLETAVHDGGGVAARMRTAEEWKTHEQGRAVANDPLIDTSLGEPGGGEPVRGTPSQPLAGVRVLDLTKVLAGPVATRVLASLGADVLRIDAPGWGEPVTQDTTVGKRCAHIDGRTREGQRKLQELLRSADLLVHGYRPGALESIGLGEAARRELNAGLVEVSLNAYGQAGPWRHRRGFDSIVQMSCGIASTGMTQLARNRPTPLPAQALDHVTGYLMAAAAIDGWTTRLTSGVGSTHRASLARTANGLMDGPAGDPSASIAPANSDDYSTAVEHTSWGPARRLRLAFTVPGVDLRWALPASALGSLASPIVWLPR